MNEINFDGLVGPTHNYAGLAFGNVASQKNAGLVSNPRQAALQGLDKMRVLMEMGIPQGVYPPALRPNLDLLRQLGFSGKPLQMLKAAHAKNPALLAAIFSASSMWMANAATISPSCNTKDHKVHITPANLSFNLHRAQECTFNYKLLKEIFRNPNYFVVHEPLPGFRDLSDEGAANHSVLCREYGKPGLELFVYGRHGLDESRAIQHKFAPRQTELACMANAQMHQLDLERCLFLQQNGAAIDAGAFHNDVVFVANKNVLLYHTQAFIDWESAKHKINTFFADECFFIGISSVDLTLSEAIETYLFNSQIVSLADGSMTLVAPGECAQFAKTHALIDKIIEADNPITDVRFVECRQSMQNGGGPACLRLRLALNQEEFTQIPKNLMLTKDLYNKLNIWVNRHYRERIAPPDLLDPQLLTEVETALEELTTILQLGSIYPFQEI